jgi:hypothetical protein
MISITEYEKYFENLASFNNNIEAFHKLDLFDIDSSLAKLREKPVKTVLLLETYAVRKYASNSDQVFDTPVGAFLVMQSIDNPRGDLNTQRDAILKETEQICNSMEARLKHDMEAENSFMADLDINSLVREKIGPDLDNRWGWRVMFKLKTWNPMQLIPSEWSDL